MSLRSLDLPQDALEGPASRVSTPRGVVRSRSDARQRSPAPQAQPEPPSRADGNRGLADLYLRRRTRLASQAHRWLAHYQDAEDVVQDVFLRLLARPPARRITVGLLNTMVRGRAVDVWRARELRWGRPSPRPGAHRAR